MHRPQSLRFSKFSAKGDPLVALGQQGLRQASYLRCYLHDLGAKTVIIEPNYFDRDYLSEFAAFYSTSAAGYPNICQRAHYFAAPITRARFEKAVGGDAKAKALVETSYLGHVILRPIPGAPIGRTVVRTYPDDPLVQIGTPRITQPAREYEAHVAGLVLRVSGIAWQQQDSAVGSCSTVALWSMLHSSAFDDHHAIPTTAEITAMAHATAPTGRRIFPDAGLQLAQVLEVIKGHGLAPIIIPGDLDGDGFSRERFCSLIASFVRSGYPVLVSGWLDTPVRELHTVCIVGFRSPTLPVVDAGQSALADENIDIVYVHDDNLGPNARFKIETDTGPVTLSPAAPPPRRGDWPAENPTMTYFPLEPTELILAVHQELRTDPLELQRAALKYSSWLPDALEHETTQQRFKNGTGMVVSSRFIRLRDYVEHELASALCARDPSVLARARLSLWEEVPPMSLHIGLVRVSLETEPMLDLLFDTSDSDRHLRPMAHVAYQRQVPWLFKRWRKLIGEELDVGMLVRAW